MLYRPEVENYINDLVHILFKKDYYSYLENAILYKDKIIDFIEENISTFPCKTSPLRLKALGSKYIFCKINSHTTWYIFFESKGNTFIVTYIFNNHSEQAKWI